MYYNVKQLQTPMIDKQNKYNPSLELNMYCDVIVILWLLICNGMDDEYSRDKSIVKDFD